MANQISVTVTKRNALGKKVKNLRFSNQLPAVVYGGAGESQPLIIGDKDFKSLYKRVGETGLFYLEIEGEQTPRPVLMGEVQRHPLSLSPVHVSFKQVSLKDKITADVPVVLTGEFGIPDAVVVVARDEIEVEALPTNIPEKFEIDVSKFTAIGQSVSLAELQYDKKLVTLTIDEDQLGEPVVLVQAVKEEVIEEIKPDVEETGVGQATPTTELETAPAAPEADTAKKPVKK